MDEPDCKPARGAPARRERRAAARKDQILDAAVRLFAGRGYHRTTTKDIAVEADISEGTIYNYFSSKEALLFAILARLVEQTDPAGWLMQTLPEDPKALFQAMLRYRQEFIEKNFPMLRAVLSEILVNPDMAGQCYRQLLVPIQANLEEHLQRRVEAGQIRPMDTSLMAKILVATVFGFFLLQAVGEPVLNDDWERFSGVLTEIIFEGVAPGGNADGEGR